MKFLLVDQNGEMCDQWSRYFKDCKDVEVYQGDFFAEKTDCVVSPANSFGFMDGGLDGYITKKLGSQVQRILQEKIQTKYKGELLVGQAVLIPTDSQLVPYLISAPTMRDPMILGNESINPYLATKAIFSCLNTHNFIFGDIETVTIPGLGTGVGQIPFDICAKQMRIAYDHVILKKSIFPSSWYQAQTEHQQLYRNKITDLQHK